MIHNGYVALLDQDTVNLKHPTIENKFIKLYRICALKTFKLSEFGITIEKNTVGGYVEGLHNLDPDIPSWVGHRSRVFDNAKISYGSLLTESCVVFGNAEIKASRLKNYARVLGDAKVVESTLEDLVEIKDNATVVNSHMKNSTMAFNNATVQGSSLEIGSCARGDSILIDSHLTDTTQVGGTAKLINCNLLHDAKVFEGKHENITFDEEQELVYETFSGNLNDLKPVTFEFEGRTYSGYAWLIPGKSRSLVYQDKFGKNILKTRNSMNLTVTAKQLFGTEFFE
jgi:carbonic anhydrase/acetyltransferase-like protein (isoleucine patch superfamily)